MTLTKYKYISLRNDNEHKLCPLLQDSFIRIMTHLNWEFFQNKVNIAKFHRENTGTASSNSEYLQFNIIPTELNLESQSFRRSFRRFHRNMQLSSEFHKLQTPCLAF